VAGRKIGIAPERGADLFWTFFCQSEIGGGAELIT
jgi:hypothetical protein